MAGRYSESSQYISTLAPTRGATIVISGNDISIFISTLAPTRGATREAHTICRFGLYFNSRPYTRGDAASAFRAFSELIFQLSPLHEGRQGLFKDVSLDNSFQLSPLHEGRPRGGRCGSDISNFNSRPYPRGDPFLSVNPVYWQFQLSPLHEGRP